MPTNFQDPALRDHLAWLGYLQPEGLVVSAPALVDAQAIIDRAGLADLQERFTEHIRELPTGEGDAEDTAPGIVDLPWFLRQFLGWPSEQLHGLNPERPIPDSLTVPLKSYGETLAPTLAVHDPQIRNPKSEIRNADWLLLVQAHRSTVDLDKPAADHDQGWQASPAQKFERLLRETNVPIGLLTNGTHLHLVYAPAKENSGSLTFPVGAMTEVAGRLIVGAFHLLLSGWSLFNAPSEVRLPALLQRSRDYQASVSEQLAEQVLHALYELLRGFQAADQAARGGLLRDVIARDPNEIYRGLLAVLLRLVFTLFAEDRGVMPGSPLYVRNYSLHGLFERLRADAERYPDTMDARYGAWAQLLALFRAIHGGCKHPELRMPSRHGHLFNPDRFSFLEGRGRHQIAPTPHSPPAAGGEGRGEVGTASSHLPLVSDGTIHRVLQNLLLLDGERLSYRTLDVEEIGSVYQTIMGFGVEVAASTSIALKGKRKKGGVPAAPAINLDALLATKPADRPKWLKELVDTELSGDAEKRLKSATTADDLLAALDKRIDRGATPSPVPKGGLILQPTDERRRSGSHYTPRSFTEPIVRKTLEPILRNLCSRRRESAPSFPSEDQRGLMSAATAEVPTPDQILSLKICDLAVGSAAFLVETCRQLADELVKAWRTHGGRPQVPPDETEELFAMRLIAQRCLYGVDRNQMAVDLAKLSLWLATLAKDHPFTFLDHAIRCGDSLMGFTRRQLARFHWDDEAEIEQQLGQQWIEEDIRKATAARLAIINETADTPEAVRRKLDQLDRADEALTQPRLIGKLLAAAWFNADSKKARLEKREEMLRLAIGWMRKRERGVEVMSVIKSLEADPSPVAPLNWEIEFPEVFNRGNPGFDGIVGNPPFLGGKRMSTVLGDAYLALLLSEHADSHGNADLVAFFFRRAFSLIREGGVLGLIATNTISQGDTRSTGLRIICRNGGQVLNADKRFKWPGQAAVVVSVVHLLKGECSGDRYLNGKKVQFISAYLFHQGGHEDPIRLTSNSNLCFLGFKVYGQGFLFDDGDPDANSLAKMEALIAKDQRNTPLICPYLGGEELNDHPQHLPQRYAINFGDRPEEQCREWPDLYAIIKQKVKPEREKLKRDALRRRWWQYGERQPGLVSAMVGLEKVIVCCQTSKYRTFTFCPSHYVFSHKTVVICSASMCRFAVLHSRCHELWALFLGSSMKDDPVYTGSDCFEPFPFPSGFETNPTLETAGREYFEFRAALMVRNNEGLTRTYNRFHDPEERSTDVLKLREMHAAMDAAVLTAYGWLGDDGKTLKPAEGETGTPLSLECKFLLDYEEEDDDEEDTGGRKKKKPWRYRWPDDVRDEVLARLLKLNAERAEEERRAGVEAAKAAPAKSKRRRGRSTQPPGDTSPAQGELPTPPQRDLFG